MAEPARFYIYDDPAITVNNWLSHIPSKDHGHLEEDLYVHFLNHSRRTLNPDDARVFIIGIPMVKSCLQDQPNHSNNMKTAFTTLMNNTYFQRHSGRDHLILADDWRLSAWDDFGVDKEFYQNIFEHVTSTRYEVWGKSKWSTPPPEVYSKIPASFFKTNWELTRYSIIVPYKQYINEFIVPDFAKWNSRKHLIFYRDSMRMYAHGATELREKPVVSLSNSTNCCIGSTLPYEEWRRNFMDSKFALVVKGDTPGSHSFVNGISVGCIPIIISDLFEHGCTPFNTLINLNDYAVIIREEEFMSNPSIVFKRIEKLSEETIKQKLNTLVEVQKLMLIDHPESKLCSLLLDAVSAAQN